VIPRTEPLATAWHASFAMLSKQHTLEGVTLMASPIAYSAFIEIEGGELVRLATYPTRVQAQEAIQSFRRHWPGTYTVREISGAKDGPARGGFHI